MASPFDRISTVYIGYDSSEHKAYQVARYTILKHTPNVQVVPIVQDWLRANEIYTRPVDVQASNDFSMTRWLVPFLSSYRGISLFVDCDVLATRDLNEMLRPIDNINSKACWVVKHNYTPKTNIKMDGKTQHQYPCKNWGSVVLWNCSHPLVRKLTPEFVNNSTPADLHQFKWLDHSFIGQLAPTWNWLVGELDSPDGEQAEFIVEPTDVTPAVCHFTLGVPTIHHELFTADYAALWEATYDEMLARNLTSSTRHSRR